VSVSYPLPGTTFYERVKADLGEKQNWVDSGDLAMMYRATYGQEFYRALHALVHAEFRQRRAVDLLAALGRRPQRIRLRTAREIVGGIVQAVKRRAIERRVRTLAQQSAGDAAPRRTLVLIPVLSQQAAAVPSEQSP
jgi:RNase P protein component